MDWEPAGAVANVTVFTGSGKWILGKRLLQCMWVSVRGIGRDHRVPRQKTRGDKDTFQQQ